MHLTPHQWLSLISEAIGVWVDQLQVNQLLDAPFSRLMAEECTDIATVGELSFFFVDGWKINHLLNISWELSL